jgi:hypothetical protein
LRLLADDGARVYVNGTLLVQDNVQASGPWAAAGRSGVDENAWRTFTIPTSAVVTGLNTVAVSVHQDWTGSGDVSFALELTGTVG